MGSQQLIKQKNQHLQQFAQQLATWTEAIIEHGRTPFRRVDLFPQIDTEQGSLQPPLVFWINRQSMMAGGVLFLPENNLKEELERGRHCASALGLRHFITWETDRVRIWQVVAGSTREQQSFPLADPQQPETFRQLLVEVLVALKFLAVTGTIPIPDLSPYYFNNLFQITLQQALPPLIEVYRRQRSEITGFITKDGDAGASEANRLLLLQVLALLWFRKFPEVILPEKMERAIELTLTELPEHLQQALAHKINSAAPPLPLETAVCFYHLLLRLQQLSWNQPTERAQKSIQHLAEYWFQNGSAELKPAAIHLYPATLPTISTTTIILSDSPALLAMAALLADPLNSSPDRLISGNVFHLDRETFSSQPVVGRLLNGAGILSSERRKYTARLRISWPNRHLKVRSGQPFWLWELAHLLGLCHEGQTLCLELPLELLSKPEHELVWFLLYENFSFSQVQLLSNGNVKVTILPGKKMAAPFPLQLADEVRQVTPHTSSICFKNQLLLTLVMPTYIYKLIGKGLIWPEHNGISDEQLSGWKIYSESRLYKRFKGALLNRMAQSKRTGEMVLATVHTTIPHPEPLLLNKLINFSQTKPEGLWLESLDNYLAKLLACPAIENPVMPDSSKKAKAGTTEVYTEKETRKTIAAHLSAYGIPNFPDQYLYFLDCPEMCRYRLTPPLLKVSNLLGQFELKDAKGEVITGYGGELEQTLLLCAEAGKTEIDLPKDRYQLEQLLQYYQKDLESLHKHLNAICYSQVNCAKSARKLVKTIWKDLNLPSLTGLKDRFFCTS